jgi:hypothetical protein
MRRILRVALGQRFQLRRQWLWIASVANDILAGWQQAVKITQRPNKPNHPPASLGSNKSLLSPCTLTDLPMNDKRNPFHLQNYAVGKNRT